MMNLAISCCEFNQILLSDVIHIWISGLMDCPPKCWQHSLSIRKSCWHYLYTWLKLFRSKTARNLL